MPSEGSSGEMGGAGSLLSRFGGIASLVGISTPGGQKSKEYLALLESTLITQKFISKFGLLPILYAKKWDVAKNDWRSGVRVPTLWEASQYFKSKIRHVSRNSETGLVTLSITWNNPRVAADWANSLVRITNDYAQLKAVNRARREIEFLNEQAVSTKYVEERKVAFSILENELTQEMIAKGADDYALKVIDPAFAPERPTFPKPILWALLGFLVGAVSGCGYALVRHPILDSTRSVRPAAALNPDAARIDESA